MRHAVISWVLLALLAGRAGAAPSADADIQIRFALVLSRHGVRSAITAPARLATWARDPWPDFGVPPGNLTPHGLRVVSRMGGWYRAAFVASGLLSGQACSDAARTYILADVDQRTRETARGLADGLFPGCTVPIDVPAVHPAALIFHSVDARLGTPDRVLAASAVNGRVGENLAALHDAYGDAFAAIEQVTGRPLWAERPAVLPGTKGLVELRGPFGQASTISELFELEYANGFPIASVGWGRISTASIESMSRLHTLYFDLMHRTRYLAQVAGSNLLSRIDRTIEQATRGVAVDGAFGPPGKKLVIIVGHDTNIANVSGLLDVSWLIPGYQANDPAPGGALLFEVGRRLGDGVDVVRLSYVAQTLEQMRFAVPLSLAHPPGRAALFIPACGSAMRDYWCPVTTFSAIVHGATDPQFIERPATRSEPTASAAR